MLNNDSLSVSLPKESRHSVMSTIPRRNDSDKVMDFSHFSFHEAPLENNQTDGLNFRIRWRENKSLQEEYGLFFPPIISKGKRQFIQCRSRPCSLLLFSSFHPHFSLPTKKNFPSFSFFYYETFNFHLIRLPIIVFSNRVTTFLLLFTSLKNFSSTNIYRVWRKFTSRLGNLIYQRTTHLLGQRIFRGFKKTLHRNICENPTT